LRAKICLKAVSWALFYSPRPGPGVVVVESEEGRILNVGVGCAVRSGSGVQSISAGLKAA